jgi:hypothetical protein
MIWLGTINVDFDAIDHLFIAYGVFIKYLRKMWIKCGSTLVIYRLQEGLWYGQEGGVCNITIKFGTELNLFGALKMYVNEPYTEIWTGKHLSDN